MNRDKRYNYVYKIKYITGKYYIGVRSCDCKIEDDLYFGSAFNVPKSVKLTGMRCILSTWSTREQAELEEIRLHKLINVKEHPDYYNECNANSTNFYPSKAAIKQAAAKRKGRTAETHEYVRKQAEKRKQYKGDTLTEAQQNAYASSERSNKLRNLKGIYVGKNRTDKQKLRDLNMLGISQGPNPKKAVIGLNHGRASKPWWYITDNGTYIEVMDSVRNYCKHNTLPVSHKSINRYLSGESNPDACNSKCKGWKFGYLINLNTVPE